LHWQIDGEDGCITIKSSKPFGAFLGYGDPEVWLNGEKLDVEEVRGVGDHTLGPVIGLLSQTWLEYAKGERVGRYATIIQESMETGARITI